VGGRRDIKADGVTEFIDELRIIGKLELPNTVRLEAVGAPDSVTELALISASLAISEAIQWVVSPGGSSCVRVATHAITSGGQSRGARKARLVAQQAFLPSCMNSSCQRHMHAFDVPVRRMISLVPTLSVLRSTISARQTCFRVRCDSCRSARDAPGPRT
jgi:hypothetical protein